MARCGAALLRHRAARSATATSRQSDIGNKYEVLERWGYLDGQQLRDAGVTVPDERLHESFFSNVWMLPDGTIIKAVLQPINGVTWPYHLYYFDKDESSIFGEGLASIMRDDQTMLNASTRLMLDNAAMTAGAQLEVNPHLLSAVGQGRRGHAVEDLAAQQHEPRRAGGSRHRVCRRG
jgi:hypothetical protein